MSLPAIIIHSTHRIAVLVMFAGAGSVCVAHQPAAEPATPPAREPASNPAKDPALTDTSLPDVAAGQRSRPMAQPVRPTLAAAKSLTPPSADGMKPQPVVTMASIPGLPAEAAGLPARRFYPEGTFLDRRRGKLIKISTSDVVFIPERDAKGKGEQPMVVLPCQNLARLEATPDAFEQPNSVVLSGQIFVYFDRQYMLPSAYSVDRSGAETPAAAPKAAPTNQPTDPKSPVKVPAAADAADPSVADLIKDIEGKRGSAKAIELAPKLNPDAKVGKTPSADAKDAKTDSAPAGVASQPDDKVGVTSEGTVLFNRRARLVRTPGGQLAMSFDGDSNTPAPAAMVLLRCRMSQRLEELTLTRGEGLQVLVSGRVMIYAGHNYIMPSLAQVVSTSEVKAMQ